MENHQLSIKCPIHQEITLFYCLDALCNHTVVCKKCVSSGKHLSHRLVDQEDAELLIQTNIKECLEQCSEPLRSFWAQFRECKTRIQRSLQLIEHTLLQILNPITALKVMGLQTTTTNSRNPRISIELEQKLYGIAVDLEQICENLKSKREWKLTSTLEGHEGVIYCSALSADKMRMATGSGDMSVIVWDLKNQKLMAQAQNAHQGVVWCVAYGVVQGKEFLASGSDDNTIKTWMLQINDSTLQSFNCFNTNDAVFSLIYRNEELIAGVNSVIMIYDSEQMKEIAIMKGHKDYISTMDYKDNILVSGSKDKNVMIWDLDRREKKCILEGHTNTIRSVIIQGDLIGSGGYDKQLRIWEWKQGNTQGKLIHILEHGDVIWTLQLYFSQQNTLMSGCKDGKLRLWDMKSGVELERIECGKGVMSMQCLEEGRLMVCMSNGVQSYVDMKFYNYLR